MEDFKGTKGKWNLFTQDDDIHIESDSTAEAIATLVGWNNDEKGIANAKLIASAPELLKLVENSLKFLEYIEKERFSMWSNKTQEMYSLISDSEKIIKEITK